MKPIIYSKKDHSIKNRQITTNALTVLRRLKKAGYDAYLVGGSVRDLLLGQSPKDFDVVTNAHPSDIKLLFHNSRIIGRRFRLVHVLFGRNIIEVATFRSSDDDEESKYYQKNDSGFVMRDNVYGTIDTDAFRRDFTINALYYDAETQEIIDYCDGFDSLQRKEIQLIGDPSRRFEEDPVRILRAIRFEAKLGFYIDPDLQEPIQTNAHLLRLVSASRMYDEVIKLFLTGHGAKSLRSLLRHDLFALLFPETYEALKLANFPDISLVNVALANSDRRYKQEQNSSPYFLYASLMWEGFRMHYERLKEGSAEGERALVNLAADHVYKIQRDITTLPRYVKDLIVELWHFQSRLTAARIRNIEQLMLNKRFKPAYDFLLLRAEAGESNFIVERASYWKEKWEVFEATLSDE